MKEFDIKLFGRIKTKQEALNQIDASSYSLFGFGSFVNFVLFFRYLTTFYGFPILIAISLSVLSLRLLKHNSVQLATILLVLFGCYVVVLQLNSALVYMKNNDWFLLAVFILLNTLWFGIRGVQATLLLNFFKQNRVPDFWRIGAWTNMFIVCTTSIIAISKGALPQTIDWELHLTIGFGLGLAIIKILSNQTEQTKQSILYPKH